MQRQQAKNTNFLVCPWKVLNCILSQLLTEYPVSMSLHLHAEYGPPLGKLTGLGHPQLLRTTEIKKQLAQPQRFNRQPGAQPRLIDLVHLPHETTLSQTISGERKKKESVNSKAGQ